MILIGTRNNINDELFFSFLYHLDPFNIGLFNPFDFLSM